MPKDRKPAKDLASGGAKPGPAGKGPAGKSPRVAKAKKKCCKDKPRCAECPVVLMRLERMGYAAKEPGKKRRYAVSRDVPKKAMLVARQR